MSAKGASVRYLYDVSIRNQILEKMKNGEGLIFVDTIIEFGKNDTMTYKGAEIYDK